MSAERIVLLVSGLPHHSSSAMEEARAGLQSAGLEPLELGLPPLNLQAEVSRDTPASVPDDAIEEFVSDNEWILKEVDGLMVVNRNTEVVPASVIPRQRRPAVKENMRVTNSIGRVCAALMTSARATMTDPRSIFLSHRMPVRVGEPTPLELARKIEDRIAEVARLAPIPLLGKVSEINLGSRTR